MIVNKIELDNLIKDCVKRKVSAPRYRVFYFGSRVTGQGTERSDIDLGFEGEKAMPLNELSDIKEELDNIPILQKFDFVDFCNVDSAFKKIALQNIKVIYEQ